MEQTFRIIRNTVLPSTEAPIQEYRYVLAIFLSLFFIGVLLSFQRRESFLRTYVVRMLITVGALGLVVYLFRYENVLYFDLPFWIYVLYGLLLGWIVWLLGIRFMRLPKARKQQIEQNLKLKYLPKSHK